MVVVSYHILLDIFVLVFRCFFSVNYSYSNAFRTENRVVRSMRAGVLLGLVMPVKRDAIQEALLSRVRGQPPCKAHLIYLRRA